MHRILYAGTPYIAVPLLRNLYSSGFDIAGVITSPDKMQGRSSALVPSPVKVCAQSLGLKVLEFDSLRTEARSAVSDIGADTLVSFAYGRIFGPKFLGLFTGGTFNVHPSALPHLRGASPLVNTILECSHSGCVTLQEIGLKMDEGGIFAQCSFELDGTERISDINEKASACAASFVPSAIKDVFDGKITPVPQCGDATYCTTVDHTDSYIDFSENLSAVHSRIRAMYPWPKACCMANDRLVFITSVRGGFDYIADEPCLDKVPCGTVVGYYKEKGLGIACADKTLWVTGMQLPSKKELCISDFVNGNKWIKDAVFSAVKN